MVKSLRVRCLDVGCANALGSLVRTRVLTNFSLERNNMGDGLVDLTSNGEDRRHYRMYF